MLHAVSSHTIAYVLKAYGPGFDLRPTHISALFLHTAEADVTSAPSFVSLCTETEFHFNFHFW
jgi:hypothetical protein